MARGRLLVLDDDETVGQTLVFGAQACGLDSLLCTTTAAFRTELQARPPTHVAIDLHLAGGDGREVLGALVALQCQASVIICSGSGPAELAAALEQARALGLRTVGVLAKPFRLASLRALLSSPVEPG
jgi:ActR/RegA family two-component response regulator